MTEPDAPAPEPAPRPGSRAQGLAARPLDTLAIPLVAPLARSVLRLERLPGREKHDAAATAALDLLDTGPALDSPAALAAIHRAGMLVMAEGGTLYVMAVTEWLGAGTLTPLPTSLVRAWLTREEPPLAHVALLMAVLADLEDFDPRGTHPHRDLARVLFHYARAQGVSDWGQAWLHAHAFWGDPINREALLIRNIHGLAAESLRLDDRLRELERRTGAARRPPPPPVTAPRPARRPPPPPPPPPSPDPSPELQRQLDLARAAASKKQALIARLEAEAAPLRQERDQAVRDATALRALLTEARETAHAGLADAIDPPPSAWPPDLLAGLTIALFTGQARAGARAAMAEELRLVGAAVEVFHAEVPGRIHFAPGTTVICDVRFMSHCDSERVKDAAARSGVLCAMVEHGQGGLVRAVAGIVGRGRRS